MTTLKTGGQAKDQTYGTLESTIWTTIEANTGIICACLPMLKAPLAHMLPCYSAKGSKQSSADSARPKNRTSVTAKTYCKTSAPLWDNHGMPIRPQQNGFPASRTRPSSHIAAYGADKPFDDFSDESYFELDRVARPRNVITKTTSVNVQYADDHWRTTPMPQRSKPNSDDHTRSTSYLVNVD